MNPIVSIIMATYNRAHFIVETLQSIQKQTYTNWECLLIDDGGSDNTKEVIKPFIDNDHRFHYVKRPTTYKKGLPGCRNYGLDIAKGTYIVFFDDDDIVHPQNLELSVNLLNNNQETFFCHYNKSAFQGAFSQNRIKTIHNPNYITTPLNFLEQMVMQKIGVASCTVLWGKQCFENIRFDENLMYAEEWECYQRIFSVFSKGLLVKEVLYFNRKHLQSNTGEFYSNNSFRLNSKKEAVQLVTQNLYAKNLMTSSIFNYLMGLTISFRDIQLLKDILKISKIPFKKRVFLTFKFYLFPIWKRYKLIEKRIK